MTGLTVLREQLWIDANDSGPPTPNAIAPPSADVNGRPHGGLWTSTLVDGSSAWRDAMLKLLAGHVAIVKRRAWAVTPQPARVWHVETRAAELDLVTIAPGPVKDMWATVAQTFDAVHMTAQAASVAFHRTPRPGEPGRDERLRVLHALTGAGLGSPLDMWEAESTIWFGWHFADVRDLGLLDVAQIPPYAAAGRS